MRFPRLDDLESGREDLDIAIVVANEEVVRTRCYRAELVTLRPWNQTTLLHYDFSRSYLKR